MAIDPNTVAKVVGAVVAEAPEVAAAINTVTNQVAPVKQGSKATFVVKASGIAAAIATVASLFAHLFGAF